MKLKLKEIIWEITGKCNNGCSYCGSKDVWKNEIDENLICKIANSIAEYPPEEIDISGGDPLLVSHKTHKHIKEKLGKTTKCKILINPKSLLPLSNPELKLNILRLYDHVGVSINTLEEMELFKVFLDFLKTLPPFKFNYTVVTNFNLGNFFLFDTFAQSPVISNVPWQIQFTMYHDKDKNQSFALYSYPDAVNKLNESIAKYPYLKLIIADNCNAGECSAGIYTIGILSNGDVVPCLSMRSWCDMLKISEGNVLSTKLKEIWLNGFKANRFETFKCCKDVCNRELLLHGAKKIEFNEPTQQTFIPVYGVQLEPPSPWKAPITVMMYAVQTDQQYQQYPQYPFIQCPQPIQPIQSLQPPIGVVYAVNTEFQQGFQQQQRTCMSNGTLSGTNTYNLTSNIPEESHCCGLSHDGLSHRKKSKKEVKKDES